MKTSLIPALTFTLWAACLGLLTAPAALAADRPNIIFILADDYGIGEVGCYGADHYKTPNIDALARSGTRYTHAYTISSADRRARRFSPAATVSARAAAIKTRSAKSRPKTKS